MSTLHAWPTLPDGTHLKANATSRALELWNAANTTLLASTAGSQHVHATAYGAKGDGATDDTTAIQAALTAAPAGSVVHLPENSVCSATITVAKRLTVTGGRLLFNTGVTNTPAISITAAGVTLDGVTLVNPNELQSATGGRNIGVQVNAHESTITGCTIDRFQNGIVVEMAGEFSRHRIINNRIVDVIGAGGGPASASADGEDRGDGIVVWGSQAVIVGNVVNAKAGTDARIGIHCESLPLAEITPGNYSSAQFTVNGNVVYGQFRRGISFEEIYEGVMSGNSVADSTWWGISLANNCRSSLVSNNTVYWTRAATDNQGSAYAPMRTPILVFGTAHDSVITNNTVRVTGAADAYIGTQGTGAGVTDVTISGNTGYLNGGTVTDGIRALTTVRLKLDNNRVTGFTGIGASLFNATDIDVYDNQLVGGAGATNGIQSSGTCTRAQIHRNTITGTTVGINLNNHTGRVSVLDNTLRSVTGAGVDLFGSNAGGRVGRNDLTGSTGYVNLHASVTNLDAGAGGATNLAFTRDATTVTVTSDTGTDAAIPVADASNAGIFPAASFTKLAGLVGVTLWATGTVYAVGDHVNSGDRLYRATTAHTASAAFATDTANWQEVAAGAAGTSGNIQFAGTTGQLAGSSDLVFNDPTNVLTVPNLWVTGVHRWFDPVDAPQITASQNNWSPFGAGNLVGSVWTVDADAAGRIITGIDATSITDGTVLNLLNRGTQTITLRGSDAGSTAANRFGWTGDWSLKPGQTANLIYSTDTTRWAAGSSIPTATVSQLLEHTDSVRGTVIVGDQTLPAWPVPAAGLLTAVRVTVGAALAGGGITVRFNRISPGAFATPTDVTLAAGAISGTATPAVTSTVAAGDLLQATVTALTATNVTAIAAQVVVTT